VGIGTTSPAEAFNVQRGAGLSAYAEFAGNNNTLGSTSVLYGQDSGSNGYFWNRANGPVLFGTNNTERMRITSAGAVGIGTNAPNSGINGGFLSVQVDQAVCLSLYRPSSNPAKLGFFDNTGNSAIGSGSGGGNLVFYCDSSTERARIDQSGNFIISKNTTSLSTVGTLIQPNGSIFATIASGTNTYHVYSSTATAYRFYVTETGTINAVNTTIAAISDQRLKENITDIDVGLDAIMALKPRKFDWRAGKGKDIKGDRGFIAQEFEQVFPDLVSEWLDPAPTGEEPYKSVRQDLIPVLVKAIQELSAEVTALKAKVGA
jgi:hypothetical protein